MTCHGNPARTTWMKPSLDQPANTFPDWLPKLADREIDVAFTGCVALCMFAQARCSSAWPSGMPGMREMASCPMLQQHTLGEAHERPLLDTSRFAVYLLLPVCSNILIWFELVQGNRTGKLGEESNGGGPVPSTPPCSAGCASFATV